MKGSMFVYLAVLKPNTILHLMVQEKKVLCTKHFICLKRSRKEGHAHSFSCHHLREHEKNTFDLLLYIYITPVKLLLKICNGKGFGSNRNHGYDNRKGQFLSSCYKSLYWLNGLMNPGLLCILLMIFQNDQYFIEINFLFSSHPDKNQAYNTSTLILIGYQNISPFICTGIYRELLFPNIVTIWFNMNILPPVFLLMGDTLKQTNRHIELH